MQRVNSIGVYMVKADKLTLPSSCVQAPTTRRWGRPRKLSVPSANRARIQTRLGSPAGPRARAAPQGPTASSLGPTASCCAQTALLVRTARRRAAHARLARQGSTAATRGPWRARLPTQATSRCPTRASGAQSATLRTCRASRPLPGRSRLARPCRRSARLARTALALPPNAQNAQKESPRW